MRRIAVLSGKGGTGKTSLVAAFTCLAESPVVVADCDVDAANLSLALPGTDLFSAPFHSGKKATIDGMRCTGCGACLAVCRFDALTAGRTHRAPTVNALTCEGCRACATVCAEDAVAFTDHRAGRLFVRNIENGALVYAALGIAEGNSGKLVTAVKESAVVQARKLGSDTLLIDGPPGIGCPVHATLGGVDLVVAVTEPTPSGAADLTRLLDLTDHFGITAQVIVNKFDLCLPMTETIERAALRRNAEPIGRIAFDTAVPKALSRHRTLLDVPSVHVQAKALWQRIFYTC